MTDTKAADGDIDRLCAAVADRFNASARTARLATSEVTRSVNPALLDRLASAVGQRLALAGDRHRCRRARDLRFDEPVQTVGLRPLDGRVVPHREELETLLDVYRCAAAMLTWKKLPIPGTL